MIGSNMFECAYLEELGSGKLRMEEAMVASELNRRGVPVQYYTRKLMSRRQLPVTRKDFIMGDMDVMHGAMRMLGIPVPQPDDYPEVLREFRQRRIWKSTIGKLTSQLSQDGGMAVFVKPAGRRKMFTGRVLERPEDSKYLHGVSRNEEIWCSEVVEWVSEYRIYVVGDQVLAVDHYAGDSSLTVDEGVVQRAVTEYARSGTAPAAYGIDFGVLATGQTALVEANDGYALGAYHVSGFLYTEVLTARWKQLSSL